MCRCFRAWWLAVLGCGSVAGAAGAAETTDPARLDHLIKAAAHLERAGLAENAAAVRALAAQTPAEARARLLKQKLAALSQLEAELVQLRQLAAGGRPPAAAGPQVSITLKVVEFHPAQLRKRGVPLLSLQGLAEGASPTSVVDDQGTLSEFFELLEKQGLVTVLSRPRLIATSGQPATVSVGSLTRPAERAGRASAGRLDGFEFQCTPRVGAGDRITLDVAFCSSADKARDGRQPAAGTAVEGVGLRTCVEVKSGQRAVLGGLRTGPAEDIARILLLDAEIIKFQAEALPNP